jgi:hypothetical protein
MGLTLTSAVGPATLLGASTNAHARTVHCPNSMGQIQIRHAASNPFQGADCAAAALARARKENTAGDATAYTQALSALKNVHGIA